MDVQQLVILFILFVWESPPPPYYSLAYICLWQAFFLILCIKLFQL